VIPSGGKSATVKASIRLSPLWSEFVLRNLTHPQQDASNAGYSQFINPIGDRAVESTYSVDRDTQLMKLDLMGVTTNEEETIWYIFPDMNGINLRSERAIITGTNAMVDDLSGKIMKKINRQVFLLYSVTHLALEDTHLGQFLTEKSLHSLKPLSMPNHHL